MTRSIPTARAAARSALGALALSAPAFAQQPGDKTVRFILPSATGSGVDTITRAAQPALSKALGQPVVIENQPGAGGIVGTAGAGQARRPTARRSAWCRTTT